MPWLALYNLFPIDDRHAEANTKRQIGVVLMKDIHFEPLGLLLYFSAFTFLPIYDGR
jgi:hypothetical protein